MNYELIHPGSLKHENIPFHVRTHNGMSELGEEKPKKS